MQPGFAFRLRARRGSRIVYRQGVGKLVEILMRGIQGLNHRDTEVTEFGISEERVWKREFTAEIHNSI
jgi:hypothetical protein